MLIQKKASHIFDTKKKRLLNQDSESVLYNPIRKMKKKGVGVSFFHLPFYLLFNNNPKSLLRVENSTLSFPITFNFQ